MQGCSHRPSVEVFQQAVSVQDASCPSNGTRLGESARDLPGILPSGKSNIGQLSHYNEEKRQGVLAHFYGAGCKPGNDGWSLLVVSDATEQEFDTAAILASSLAAMAAGLPPSAGFTSE